MSLHTKIPCVHERSLLLGRPNENYSRKIGIVNTQNSDNISLMSRYLEIKRFDLLQGGMRSTDNGIPLVELYKRRSNTRTGVMTGPYYMSLKTYKHLCWIMCVEQRQGGVTMIRKSQRTDVAIPGQSLEFKKSESSI